MDFKSIVVFTITVLVFLSCGKKKKITTTKQPTTVDVLIASTSAIENTIEANGTVLADESVELRPEVSGRLIYLNIPEGKRMSQGTILARINDADIKAQINKLEVQLRLAEKTADRYKKLYELGGLNQSEYDIVVNQIATLKADISYQQAQLAKTVIRAPFTGTVGLRQVSPGAYVTPQTILATFQKLEEVKIDFTIPQEYAQNLKVGSSVFVVADDTKKHRARITAIEPQIEQTTRNLKLRAVLQNILIRPGSFVKVQIPQETRQLIMVPANAIIPEASSKKLVVIKNGKAKMAPVQTGIRRESLIAIEKGIEPGDSVIVQGVLFARPDAEVIVRNLVTLEDIIQ